MFQNNGGDSLGELAVACAGSGQRIRGCHPGRFVAFIKSARQRGADARCIQIAKYPCGKQANVVMQVDIRFQQHLFLANYLAGQGQTLKILWRQFSADFRQVCHAGNLWFIGKDRIKRRFGKNHWCIRVRFCQDLLFGFYLGLDPVTIIFNRHFFGFSRLWVVGTT